MGKPKQFTRPPPKKTKARSEPQTADEFQEAADVEEETGGKWRAGDPAKSGRAFVRALEIYDRGLQKHPKSFDLAYNKARLELEITQRPALVKHIGLPVVDLLKQTMGSHRFALRLDEGNADVLFNTAQVLCSLAEQLSEGDDVSHAIRLLQEALELLSACLSRQEMLLEQQQADFGDAEAGGIALDPDETAASSAGSEQSVQTVTIEAPVTANDLLDTVQASLSALTTLVTLVERHALDALGDMAQSLTEDKAPIYLRMLGEGDQGHAQLVLALARASFVSTFANAQFDAYLVEVDTYLARLNDVFRIANKETDADALTAEAEARTELVLSLLLRNEDDVAELSVDTCWKQLTLAQQLYTAAAKLDSACTVYLARGDVEMLRHRIAIMPTKGLSDAVRRSASTLAQNAQTYYSGAVKLAGADDVENEEKAARRLAVVARMRSSLYGIEMPVSVGGGVDVLQALEECVEDGLLDAMLADKLANMSA
ncbi:hypothetical protein LTR62_003304 [Meristemomyces frigidus]|uniref:Uncharacterized protein n=1 Tax=Meristemomyces frigidus TaxID=1508187 RepID=A0AAN7TLE8_9PEZI|nr:hypothetical protein LTR62_003304 [Meristemomyces frigidus]